METVNIPDSFLDASAPASGVTFVPYESGVAVMKGRANLTRHMISLITEGEKTMYVENETIHLTPYQILWLSAGRALFTERLGRNERIKSTMIFFDDTALQEALALGSAAHVKENSVRPYCLFERDGYLHRFIESVNALMEQKLLDGALSRVKLQELLLYLEAQQPGILIQLMARGAAHGEGERIRKVIEAHSADQLTVQELAFLCHMSLPTFKRKFEQLYNESPARWLQIQRLTVAADRLRSRTAKPGEVYLEAGYENHSSFSKAFKQYFGVLPKNYGY